MDQMENTGTGMALINVSGADQPQQEAAARIALQKARKIISSEENLLFIYRIRIIKSACACPSILINLPW
jgi:hypothetical protein